MARIITTTPNILTTINTPYIRLVSVIHIQVLLNPSMNYNSTYSHVSFPMSHVNHHAFINKHHSTIKISCQKLQEYFCMGR